MKNHRPDLAVGYSPLNISRSFVNEVLDACDFVVATTDHQGAPLLGADITSVFRR